MYVLCAVQVYRAPIDGDPLLRSARTFSFVVPVQVLLYRFIGTGAAAGLHVEVYIVMLVRCRIAPTQEEYCCYGFDGN